MGNSMNRNYSTYFFLTALLLSTSLLSSCSHGPVETKNDLAEQALHDEEEFLFVERAIAQAGAGSEIIVQAISALSRSERDAMARSAQSFLSTSEKITAANMASRFTQPQGLAFLNHYRKLNPQMFLRPQLSGVTHRLDEAFAASMQAGSQNVPSQARTGVELIKDPELYQTINEVRKISVVAAGDAFHIRKKTGALIASQPFCKQVSQLSTPARIRTLEFIRRERNYSDQIAELKTANKTQCFWATAAQGLIIFVKSGRAAKQVVEKCALAPVETLPYLTAMIKDGTAAQIEQQIKLGNRPQVNPKSLKACN